MHSNDFLVRIQNDTYSGGSEHNHEVVSATHASSAPATGAPALELVVGDRARHERLSLRRSAKLPTARVRNFGACHGSHWALDVLSERFTSGAHDWNSLRAVAVRFGGAPRVFDPTLDRIKLKDLWKITELLHVREMDSVAERALLTFISARVLDGSEFDTKLNELLIERLLHADLDEPARVLVSRLDNSTWRKHALAVELEHPRFGGSYEDMLLGLNPGFYRFGLEKISLDGTGETVFQQLRTEGASAANPGPLVTVIMTTAEPNTDAFTAALSIVEQTYQDWELIVVDDASSEDSRPVVGQIATLDSRIRIIQGDVQRGQYARRNDALWEAKGEFITFQNSHGWSHPRRIETQVRDLVADPDKLANTVRKAWVTDEFSLVGVRGTRLAFSEESLFFRRERVLDRIGYFDTVTSGAGTEYRKRLEAATGTKIGFVGPEVPLEFVSTAVEGDSQTDFEIGMSIDPEWLAYREASSGFHNQILSGERDAQLPIVQNGSRPFSAPARWRGSSPEASSVHVLVILDGKRSPERSEFIDAVVDELYVLTSTGARVALLQSDSAEGSDRPKALASGLQELIESGRVSRVFHEDEVRAEAVVVRHAVSVQGHPSNNLAVTANRVVVVEDIAGGDYRGETFAQVDVNETLSSWFGIEPYWVSASTLPPRPEVHSVVVEEDSVRLTISAPDSHQVRSIRLSNGVEAIDLPHSVNDDDDLVATGVLNAVPVGELLLSVVRGEGDLESTQGCQVTPRKVITRQTEKLLIASDRILRLIPADSVADLPSSSEFSHRFLSAKVSLARIFRDQVELTLELGPEVKIAALHLLREVDGHVRRHNFTLDESNGDTQLSIRTLDGVLDTRWKIFAAYRTPYGHVEAPVEFGEETKTQDSKHYRIRKLHSDGVGAIHIVEQALARPSDRIPTLSIVMPVFNVAPFLDTAIQSVLMQDFQDFELIIVDDASTDNGRQVIEMHRALDDRIRVIELDHNTLGGAGVPSNLGIRAARGKYLAFVDSDDWVTKTAFATLVDLAETHDSELVIGDFRTFDENDRTVSDAYDAERWRNIPLDRVISASSHPALMRLSPVPWRKLYRRHFVQAHNVLYPEGDYFYEDNPLHWHVLSRAKRVVACDEVVSYHRMAREGQTMGAFEYKLGAIASHTNTTLNSLRGTTVEHREVLFEEFIDYVSRQRWIVRRQTQPVAAKIIQRRLADIYDRAREFEPNAHVPQATVSHFADYRQAYPELDLTIVVPVYNSADLLTDTLDSVLNLDGLAYDVLLIDDGSTDESLTIMREYEQKNSNVHVFEQKNRGAGRARNAVIPLCTGRYTYFLDADDLIDSSALRQAVYKADQDEADLLFVQYRIEYMDENRSRGMFNADADIWQQLPATVANDEKQLLLSGLINYPWNRIIRTDLLHDANIFFGPTIVHNDVLYHWHSILSASNIGHLDVEVCTHRKFARRAQVTNIDDERRLVVLEALRGTHERISVLAPYSVIAETWKKFAIDLLEWAENRVPESIRNDYRLRAAALAASLEK